MRGGLGVAPSKGLARVSLNTLPRRRSPLPEIMLLVLPLPMPLPLPFPPLPPALLLRLLLDKTLLPLLLVVLLLPPPPPPPGRDLGELWGDMDPNERATTCLLLRPKTLPLLASYASCGAALPPVLVSRGSGVTARIVACTLMLGRNAVDGLEAGLGVVAIGVVGVIAVVITGAVIEDRRLPADGFRSTGEPRPRGDSGRVGSGDAMDDNGVNGVRGFDKSRPCRMGESISAGRTLFNPARGGRGHIQPDCALGGLLPAHDLEWDLRRSPLPSLLSPPGSRLPAPSSL